MHNVYLHVHVQVHVHVHVWSLNKGIRVPHVRDAIHMWSTRIVQKWKKKNSLEYKSLSSTVYVQGGILRMCDGVIYMYVHVHVHEGRGVVFKLGYCNHTIGG